MPITRWPISRAAAIGVVCRCFTPLGSPVEPEVYIQNATSSEVVGAVNGVAGWCGRSVVEVVHLAALERGFVGGVAADQQHRAQAGQAVDDRRDRARQRRGGDQR